SRLTNRSQEYRAPGTPAQWHTQGEACPAIPFHAALPQIRPASYTLCFPPECHRAPTQRRPQTSTQTNGRSDCSPAVQEALCENERQRYQSKVSPIAPGETGSNAPEILQNFPSL